MSPMREPAPPALSECRCHSTAEWNNVRPAATMDTDAQTVIARQGTGGGISATLLFQGHGSISTVRLSTELYRAFPPLPCKHRLGNEAMHRGRQESL